MDTSLITKLSSYFKSVWKDPVWSKLIAAGILGIVALLWNFAGTCNHKSIEEKGSTIKNKNSNNDSLLILDGRRVMITYIDCSISDTTVLQKYINTIQTSIIKNIRPNDVFVLLPIDGGAKTKTEKLAYFNYTSKSDMQTLSEKFDFRKKLIEFSSSLSDIVQQKLVQRFSYRNSSDILGGLQESRQYISDNSNNIIVVFSNMIQETKEYSFSHDFSNDTKNRYLTKLITQKSIPFLKNCAIIVQGVNSQNNIQFDLVREFWEEYFVKTQAKLISYTYENSSIIENTLKTE